MLLRRRWSVCCDLVVLVPSHVFIYDIPATHVTFHVCLCVPIGWKVCDLETQCLVCWRVQCIMLLARTSSSPLDRTSHRWLSLMVKSQGVHMRFVDVPKSKVLETACPAISIELHLDEDVQELKKEDTQPPRDLQEPVISALPQSNETYKNDCMGNCMNMCYTMLHQSIMCACAHAPRNVYVCVLG